MLLNKVVGAILTDFVAAQDLSNEYASQISRKYKQYRDSKENILNNFDAPASLLKEIDLELKFAVTDLNYETYGLDIEETWDNCQKIAEKAVEYVIGPMQGQIRRVISELEQYLPSQPQTTGITRPQELTRGQQSQREEIAEIQDIWRKVSENLNNDQFKESVNKKITQKLFKTCKGLFLRGRESIDIKNVRDIVEEKLKEGILEHPDIKEAIKSTQEIAIRVNPDANVQRFAEQQFAEELSQAIRRDADEEGTIVNQTNVRKLIQKLPGVLANLDVMITPSFLRELPIETISSLKITVQMDSYQWVLTETGESLNKAKR
ncbi:MAG: hypothetical protein QNJ18_08535 [Xenococcaceae cyanobacterium MO_167.B52]|nr:hypothetical protein [Xenococcaceae cyanobacterium MO_167.B52]